MGKQTRYLCSFSLLNLVVEGLDNHLTQPLGSSHDVGRVHRLVRTDEHEPFAVMGKGCISSLICTDDIVLDRLTWTVLHQRYMLVGSCMVNDVRFVFFKNIEHPPAVPYGTNQDHQIQFRIFLPKLHLDVIDIILIDVEEYQLFWLMSRHLSGKF